MRKILIILICFCFLFSVNIYLADPPTNPPLIEQDITVFSWEVESEFECIAQKWIAVPLQADVYKISIFITYELQGQEEVVAGICMPDPLTGKPIFEHNNWLASYQQPLESIEPGWVDFPLEDCQVIPEHEYYLLFKIIQPPGVNVTVHGGRDDPYDKGNLWFYNGTDWEEQIIDEPDMAFKIYGNLIVSPKVETLFATHIEDGSAELWGQISDDGNDDCKIKFEIEGGGESWFYPDIWVGSYNTDDIFHETVDELEPNTKYRFRAWAKNDAEDASYGSWKYFTMDIPEYWALFFVPNVLFNNTLNLMIDSLIYSGWDEDHITILFKEEATVDNLTKKIDLLDENESYLDTTLFYIGGHGYSNRFRDYNDDDMLYTDFDDNLSKLESAGIGIIVDTCQSGGALQYLKKDGRVIVSACKSGEDIACGGGVGNFMATGFNEFGDYFEGDDTIPGGNRDGAVSIEEAFNYSKFEEYDNKQHHSQIEDCYPREYPNNKEELYITFQNWTDGRIDQVVNRTHKTGLSKKVQNTATNFQEVAQSFKPSAQYPNISKVRIRAYHYGELEPLRVSIREPNPSGSGPKDNDITYIELDEDLFTDIGTYGNYVTANFEDMDIDLDEYYIVYTTDKIGDYNYYYRIKYKNTCYGDGCLWLNTNENTPDWQEDTVKDAQFATYGDGVNMPPYVPKRPAGPIQELFAWVNYSYNFTTNDVDGDYINYTIDWGDGTQTTTEQYESGETVCVNHKWVTDGKYHIKVKAMDSYGAEGGWSDVCCVTIDENGRPDAPEIDGPTQDLDVGETYEYTFKSTDPDGDQVYYWIEWGDGDKEEWIGPNNSGETVSVSHSWSAKGVYTISAKAKDIHGAEGEWGYLEVTVPKCTSHGVPQGTQITMAPSGPASQPIESLRVGDLISSYNPTSQEVTIAEVREVCVYTENLPERLIFNGFLEVTTNHTLYINGMEWMNAVDTRVMLDNMLENIPDTPIIYPIPIISKVPSTGLTVPIYDLVIQPLYGEACGYWANGILVGGYD